MRRILAAVGLGGLLALAVIAGPAAATGTPNQGDPDKVLTVDNPNVSCQNPVPGQKVEAGNLGRTIFVQAEDPIDFVTVKSGQGAQVVFSTFDTFSGKIKLSKDVSNYVVWTCPKNH